MATADLQFDVSALDRASRTFANMATAVDRFERKLEALDRKRVEAEVGVKTDKAEREVGQFARDLQRRIGAAVKALPEIEIDADSSDAQREVARIRADLAELASKRIGVDIDAADAEARLAVLRDTLRRIGDESVDVEVRADTAAAARAIGELSRDVQLDLDTDQAERKVGAFATDLQQRISRAVESLPEIEITADSSDAQRELAAIRADMAALGDKRIGIDLDAAEAQTQVADLQARLTRLASSSADVQIRADAAAAVRDLAAVSGQVDELNRKTATVKVKVDRSLSESIVQVAALGRALGMLAVPVTLAAAVPQLASLGASAVAASGALALIPAAGAAAAASIGALTVGATGFSDAMDALAKGDVEKFNEALQKLSPNAQAAARAIQGLGDTWHKLQQATQEALFKGAAEDIQALAKAHLPALETAFVGIAGSMADARSAFVEVMTTAKSIADVRTIFANTQQAASQFSTIVGNLTGVFRDLAVVGSEFLPGLAQGFADATDRLANFVAKARETGELERFIQRGIDTVAQLGRIAENVGASLLNIFGAADDAGVSFLGTVENITAKIRAFTSSVEGQQTIVAIFTAIREVVDAVWPGIERLATAFGNVVQRLQEAGVFRQVGEAFTSIAEGAGPVIEMMGELAAAVLPPLLSIVTALGPALGPVAVGLAAISAASKGATAISTFASGLTLIGRGADDAKTKGGGLPAIFGGIGKSADDADKKTRRLSGALKLLAIPAGLAAGGAALEAIGSSADEASGSVLDFSGQLHELGLAMQQIASFDFGSIFADIESEWDTVTRSFETGTSTVGRLWAEFQREMSGFEMQPVEIAVNANTQQATAAAEQLLGQIDGSLAEIQVGGNTLPAGTALQQVLADVAAGKAEIEINGNRMPAMDALAYVIGLVNAGAGEVLINGNPVPAGQALADVLGQVNSAHAMVNINGNPMLAGAALQKVVGEINAGVGYVTIDGEKMPAEQALATVLGEINISQAQVTINGQSAPAQQVLAAYLTSVNTGSGTVNINGTAVPAQDVLNAFIGLANSTATTSTHNANTSPAQGSVDAFIGGANSQQATISINGNAVPASTALSAALAAINAGQGTVTINGQSAPLISVLGAALAQINAGQGTVTINGQSVPAQAALDALLAAVNAGRGTVTINGQSVPADQVLQAFLGRANGARPVVNVGANAAAANAAIDRAARDRYATIFVTTRGVHSGTVSPANRNARGAILSTGMHDGGVVGMARGGRLTGMAGGIAQIVPPNTWRVIGDRLKDDEAYIPINRSARSVSILGMAADRMGFDLTDRVRAGVSERIRSVSVAAPAGGYAVAASPAVQQVQLQLGPVVKRLDALQAAVRSSVPSHADVVAELRALRAQLAERRGSAAEAARDARAVAELGGTW